VRKSRYGPLRCDRCGYVIEDRERTILRDARRTDAVHLRCLSPIERTRAMVALGGTACLFCGAHLLVPALIDHFNGRHGRVLVNW
jgi:hypothetical protein